MVEVYNVRMKTLWQKQKLKANILNHKQKAEKAN